MEDFPCPKISSKITGVGASPPAGAGGTSLIITAGFSDAGILDGFSVLSNVGFSEIGLRVGGEVTITGGGTLGRMDSGPGVVGKKDGDAVGLIVVGVVCSGVGLKVGLDVV